jgi:flavorubredoxin
MNVPRQSASTFVSTPEFPREVSPGIFWLGACATNAERKTPYHVHLSQFLIVGEEKTALIDCGMPGSWDTILAQLETALDGRRLDYVMPTHPEVPHVGCLPHLMARFEGSIVVGDLRDYHLYYPQLADRQRNVTPGDEIDLGGKRVVFLPALIKDLNNSLWMYERDSRILFVSDGFSFSHDVPGEQLDVHDDPVHLPDECAMTTSEIASGVNLERASFILQRALYWSRFVDEKVLFGRIQKVIEEYPPRLIAPAHGNIIDDINIVYPIIREAHAMANREALAGR